MIGNALPDNVPQDLALPFDLYHDVGFETFPPTAALGPGRPIFYSTMYGGFWVITQYELARAIFQDFARFPQWSQGIPANPFTKVYKPLYLDAPEHIHWRRLLTPLFSPRQLQRHEDFIRGVAKRQIAKIAPAGKCELVSEFTDVLPGEMFCFMLGLPQEDYSRFARMAHTLIFGPAEALKNGGSVEAAREERAKANQEIDELIAALIPERRKNPGEDIVSVLLQGSVQGVPLSDEDIISMTTLLFFAGTDSTRAAMTYAFNALARDPQLQQKLVSDPDMLKPATNELLRAHGFHMISRVAAEDVEVAGLTIRKGDIVTLSTGAANRDPQKFPDPDRIDFARDNAHGHLTFGAGPHRCIGSHQAIMQMRIALEEWHKVIKSYEIDPDAEPISFAAGQGKAIVQSLSLRFDPVDGRF